MRGIINKILSLELKHSTSSNKNDDNIQSEQTFAETVSQANISSQRNDNFITDLSYLQNTLHEFTHSRNYSNVSITDSSSVHLGHKVIYNGDLNLNIVNDSRISVIQYNNNSNEVLINTVPNIYLSSCKILPRSFWSIRKPEEEYSKIKEPVKLVVISHTATSISNCPIKNIQLIRDIQSFHVDTHRWNDIAYNFLIGSDGNIYEGRGWGFEGAHTFAYNNRSIGISFIGCFINRMPTEEALNACKKLLERGVLEGHLSENYKLLGHRQCTPTESPGTKLFEEIMKWDHFYNKSIEEDLLLDNNMNLEC